jgi:DNA gyrase/topoisomerase IV subunit A
MYEKMEKKELKFPLSQKLTKAYFDFSQERKDTASDALYKALGREADKDIGVRDPIQELKHFTMELKEDDMLLLFSDGGYKYFKDFEEFRGIILDNAGKTPLEISQAVEAAARKRMEKSGDNVTVEVYKHKTVSTVSDSMIFEERALSDSELKEALEEESTSVWEKPTTQELEKKTSTLITEMDDMMKEATRTISQTDISRALDEAAGLNEKNEALLKAYKEQKRNADVLQKSLSEIQKKFEALKRSDAELIAAKNRRIKAMEKQIIDLEHAGQIAESEMQRTTLSLEKELGEDLAPLSGLITGTKEQKMDILDDILNGNYDLTGKEFLVIALIAQGVKDAPVEVTERAQDAINLIII